MTMLDDSIRDHRDLSFWVEVDAVSQFDCAIGTAANDRIRPIGGIPTISPTGSYRRPSGHPVAGDNGALLAQEQLEYLFSARFAFKNRRRSRERPGWGTMTKPDDDLASVGCWP